MEITKDNPKLEAAYGAIVTDGFFAAALTLHLLNLPDTGPTVLDFLGVGTVCCVFLSACWVIYDEYWQRAGRGDTQVVKRMHIQEMKEGARIEFDGKSYQVKHYNLDAIIAVGFKIENERAVVFK